MASQQTPETKHSQVSMRLIKQWGIFSMLNVEQVKSVKYFHSFHTTPHLECRGGVAALFITNKDEVYGLGHNCSTINILGLSKTMLGYRQEEISSPMKVDALSNKNIKELSIGGLVAAAVTGSGRLFWWGHCYRHHGEIMTPHVPRLGQGIYLRVTCGYRFMAALTSYHTVSIWGYIGNNQSTFLENERLSVDCQVVDFSSGLHHLAMLGVDSLVYTWGSGTEGQRGLSTYRFADQRIVKKLSDEQCTVVKCGPYSTFFISKTHELKACGENVESHLGTDVQPSKTLSKIAISGETIDIAVVWRSNNTATMVAQTAEGEIYYWGATQHPVRTKVQTFFEVFTHWETTPGLISVDIISKSPDAKAKQPNAANLSEMLSNIYAKTRPNMAWAQSSQSTLICKSYLLRLEKEHKGEECGKNYIMKKFFSDLSQDESSNTQQLEHITLRSSGHRVTKSLDSLVRLN